MSQWNSTSTASRLLAVSVSLGVTVGLFVALTLRHVLVDRIGETIRTAVFLVPARRVETFRKPSADSATPAGRPPARPHAASLGNLPPAPAPPQVNDPPAQAPSLQAAEPQAAWASAPLRTDSQTLSRAIADAEGNVQRLARSSGVELNTRRPTQSELLSATIAETAVPDCLAPNAGGSLLSIPIIAYLAIKGKCK